MTEGKLGLLLEDGIIDEVLCRLKSGKEADIWVVRHNGETVAAKLYKDRQARNFRNNAAYREGRVVGDSRTQRAIDRGSRFGKAAAEDAWKTAETDTLYKLHAHGVRTPAPVMFYEGVLLMQLVADEQGQPAPRLVDASLSPQAASQIYCDLRGQVVRMLEVDLIHGDLSPYNVLLGSQGPTIIDFPQVIAAAKNQRSEFFFRRDLENLRKHLAGFDSGLHQCAGDAAEIWAAYVRRELTGDFVPQGRTTAGKPDSRPAHGAHDQRRKGAPSPQPRSSIPSPHTVRCSSLESSSPPAHERQERASSPPGHRSTPANRRPARKSGPVVERVKRLSSGPS